MVVELALDAERLHRQHHLRPEVGHRVRRGHREVPLLLAELVGEVRVGTRRGAGVPEPLVGVDLVERPVLGLRVSDVVEHEELGLGTEVGDVGDPGVDQVALGLLGDEPRVAPVGLAEDRVGHGADQRQRRPHVVGVDECGRRVGHQQHV